MMKSLGRAIQVVKMQENNDFTGEVQVTLAV